MFVSSANPLMSNHKLTLWGLADSMMSLSRFLKEALSRRALTLFQERPMDSLVGSFGMMSFFCRGIGEVVSIP